MKPLKRHDPEEFVEDRYSWRERNEIVMRRRRAWWRRHLDWIASFAWPARIILVLADFTLCYLAIVVGFMLGLALYYLIVSS